jgi:hypothetical protein
MKHSRLLRAAGMVAAAAAFVVPASASGHPSVYEGVAMTDGNPAPGVFDPVPQARYMVTNHNNTFVLRETNGVDTDDTDDTDDRTGVMSYALLPADRRAMLDQTEELETSSGAQAHHTCDAPALTTESAVLGWQGTDPFYNYVPFQKVRAGEQDPSPLATQVRGLDDTPNDWITDVQALTGGQADLTTVSDDPVMAQTQLEAMCEALPGATTTSFVPADRIQTSARSLALAMLEPLEEEIDALDQELTAAEGAAQAANAAKAAAEQAKAQSDAAAAAARADAARSMLLAAPPSVSLADNRMAARRVARRGIKVTITSQPFWMATVQLRVSSGRAKALGLKSRVLGTKTAMTAANGRSVITVKPTKGASTALKKLRRSLTFSVSAIAGQPATATGTLTRQ